jgi:predicted N-acetyltransferase YhbS
MRGRLSIRPLDIDRDGEAAYDLRCRSFGPMSGAQRTAWVTLNARAMREGRFLGTFDGERLVAIARFDDMTQYWHGRAVPMAGVSSVAVSPEERGRGVGRSLVTALLAAIESTGYPLSVLFPSTMPLYRSLGWEVAGTSHEAVFAAHALRPLAAPAQPGGVRRAGPDDTERIREIIGRVHTAARDCGPNVRDEATLRLALRDPQNMFYLADDGVLGCGWRNGHDELFVQFAVGESEQTVRALWAVVASYCWMADTVRARVGPADPVWWLTREPVADIVDHDDWMLRVVDPVAAIAARGFPAAVDLDVPLRITDTARPASSGLWRLKVSGGSGSLSQAGLPGVGVSASPPGVGASASPAEVGVSASPAEVGVSASPAGGEGALTVGAGGEGAFTVGACGLAALYAGTPVATLRRAGLATGGDSAAGALLDSAFGATPYMLDRF